MDIIKELDNFAKKLRKKFIGLEKIKESGIE